MSFNLTVFSKSYYHIPSAYMKAILYFHHKILKLYVRDTELCCKCTKNNVN